MQAGLQRVLEYGPLHDLSYFSRPTCAIRIHYSPSINVRTNRKALGGVLRWQRFRPYFQRLVHGLALDEHGEAPVRIFEMTESKPMVFVPRGSWSQSRKQTWWIHAFMAGRSSCSSSFSTGWAFSLMICSEDGTILPASRQRL